MDPKRYLQRLKMVFGLCSQRERLCGLLYAAQIFTVAGVVYYYFQGSVGKPAPGHEIAVEPSQPIGETFRPVWGQMDKCYPVTTQRRRVRSGKKHDSEDMTPKATGGLNDADPKEETAALSTEEGEVGPLGEEPASLIPGAKGVTEKEEMAGTPAWQENKKTRKEMAMSGPEASEVDISEERPGAWVPQLLRKLWLGWFPASDIPETQSHE